MTKKTYNFYISSPLLSKNEQRLINMINELEKFLVDQQLIYTITDDAKALKIKDRDAWLLEHIEDWHMPTLCNGSESDFIYVHVSISPYKNYIKPGEIPISSIGIVIPIDISLNGSILDILEKCCFLLSSYVGYVNRDDTQIFISEQVIHDPTTQKPPKGLPAFTPGTTFDKPHLPIQLGWINYWSPETAKLLRFPDKKQDKELLSRSKQLGNGAWLVQLTDDPLDLEIPEHLQILKDAYDRFPMIGGRE